MKRSEFLLLGAFCVQRMSIKAQQELLSLSEKGMPFSNSVLYELRGISNGNDFITECNGILDVRSLMNILACCDQGTIDRIIDNDGYKNNFLHSNDISQYFFIANAAVYNTNDMDTTLHWFEKTLGWSGIIEARDEAGNGTYGIIYLNNSPRSRGNRSPYLQLMRGKPTESFAGFINVWGLAAFRQRIIDNEWTELTPIQEMPWGAHLFVLTTCDGSFIRFFEPVDLSN